MDVADRRASERAAALPPRVALSQAQRCGACEGGGELGATAAVIDEGLGVLLSRRLAASLSLSSEDVLVELLSEGASWPIFFGSF